MTLIVVFGIVLYLTRILFYLTRKELNGIVRGMKNGVGRIQELMFVSCNKFFNLALKK